VKYQAIKKLKEKYALKLLCEVFGVSRSGYYVWQKRKPSEREQAAEIMILHIRRLHEKYRHVYGSRRIQASLERDGIHCSRNRVARLMRKEGIFGQRKYKKTRTTNSKHGNPIAANTLNRDFTANRPNEKWVADITYIPTNEGWLYLAAVMDLFSRKIVGWSMSDAIDTALVEKALRMALYQREPKEGLLHHSDRGSQYTSHQIRKILDSNKIQISMSRKGECHDNAVMESFFSSLKCEWVGFQNYKTRAQARQDIFAYTEGFYNKVRLHSTLGYISPDRFEFQYLQSLNSVSI
jgi:transposase InsO family protein